VGSIGVLLDLPWPVGEAIFGLEAYFIRDWRTLQVVAYAPMLLLTLLYFTVDESPRWLAAKGRGAEAGRVMQKIAQTNGKKANLDKLAFVRSTDKCGAQSKGFSVLFASSRLTLRAVNMAFQWFSTTLCYYGLSFASTSLSGDAHGNYILNVLVEFPGYLFAAAVMDCWGRRNICMFLQAFSGLFCIASGLLFVYLKEYPELAWLQVTLSMLGKFGASACFAMVFVYAAELFPTTCRGAALGVCSTASRVSANDNEYIYSEL